MKKLNKLALVLASAITFGALVSCGQSISYVEQVGSVSDFKVKAYPGANYLTWSPSEVSYGYSIFRDGKFVASVDNKTTTFLDSISASNEWIDGAEVKYTIQNDGRDAARTADTVIGSSAFAEATVKAINPGYKSEVMYKIPALEEGKALPNFADFDYTNAEELAKLVDPTATITEREDKDTLISMPMIPYLKTKVWVTNEDETEKMSFVLDTNGWDAPANLSLSDFGNAVITTPYIGKNVIWAEFYDENEYYESKKLKLNEVELTLASESTIEFNYHNVNMIYDSDVESLKIEWKAPVDSVSGEYVKDCSYSLYYEPTGWAWKKVELTPVLNKVTGMYESLVDIPLAHAKGGRKFRFFATNPYGEKLSTWVEDDNWTERTYIDGYIPDLRYQTSSIQNIQYAVTEVNEDGEATKIALVWNPVTLNSEVSDKITYKITSRTLDPLTGEWSDEAVFEIAANPYDEKTGKMTSASFAVPTNTTEYIVTAYFEGRKQSSVSVEYYVSTYRWGYSWGITRDGKTVEATVMSSTENKAPVKNSYVVYYIPTDYNYNGELDLAVATKVECSADWEAIDGDTTREQGTIEFDFPSKNESYDVWIFEVNGDAYSEIFSSERI